MVESLGEKRYKRTPLSLDYIIDLNTANDKYNRCDKKNDNIEKRITNNINNNKHQDRTVQ